jgi:hypothetical protein
VLREYLREDYARKEADAECRHKDEGKRNVSRHSPRNGKNAQIRTPITQSEVHIQLRLGTPLLRFCIIA